MKRGLCWKFNEGRCGAMVSGVKHPSLGPGGHCGDLRGVSSGQLGTHF